MRVNPLCPPFLEESPVFWFLWQGAIPMAIPNDDRNSLPANIRVPRLENVVVREVRDRDGHRLGRVIQPHNGTEPGIIIAAQAATDRMYAEFSMPSNIQSRICATDCAGNPKWAVSPNFVHMAEIGTEEAVLRRSLN